MNPIGPDIVSRFLEEPGGHIVLNPGLVVVEVGPQYQRQTETKEQEFLGRAFLDTITDPDPIRRAQIRDSLLESFHRVIETLQPDKLPPYRCDLPLQKKDKSRERWWEVGNIPVVEDGKLVYIVHRAEDVTLPVVTHRAIQAQRRSNYLMYLLCVLLIGLITWTTQHNAHEVNKETCKVQAIALPAQHKLSQVMQDANVLLTADPASQRSPVVSNMEKDLKSYVTLTAQEPSGRQCKL